MKTAELREKRKKRREELEVVKKSLMHTPSIVFGGGRVGIHCPSVF